MSELVCYRHLTIPGQRRDLFTPPAVTIARGTALCAECARDEAAALEALTSDPESGNPGDHSGQKVSTIKEPK